MGFNQGIRLFGCICSELGSLVDPEGLGFLLVNRTFSVAGNKVATTGLETKVTDLGGCS